MAEYDPQICQSYVKRALELETSTFVRLWVHAAGFVPVAFNHMIVHQLDTMVTEWENMRPWNKQGVLFLMAKHIDAIARRSAISAAQQARVQDPI